MLKTKQENLNQMKEQIDSLQVHIDSLKLSLEQLEQQQNILKNEYQKMEQEITNIDENQQLDSNHALEKVEHQEQVPKDENILQNQAKKLETYTIVSDQITNNESKQYEEKVPVDLYLENRDDYIVYSDQQQIYNCILNMTALGINGSKFYIVQLLKQKNQVKYALFTRWGRVGVPGQQALRLYEKLENAINDYDKKVGEKIKNKYVMLEILRQDETSNSLRKESQIQ